MACCLSERKYCLELLVKYLVIYPFLGLVGIFDLFLTLLLPCKYEDPKLPKKTTRLSKQENKNDPGSPYKSTIKDELNVETGDSIYKEFVNSVDKFANFNTLGVR